MKFLYLYILTFVSTICFAQLPPFVLNAVATNEVCLNNGSVTASVQNTTIGATISYQIFRLPNITAPISTTNIANGLSAGIYRVVATKSLTNPQGVLESNVQQQDVTILNQLVDLEFTITKSSALNCATFGSLIVNTITGNPISYEIVSGPVVVPSQTSNQFNNLPAGLYQIRVFDNCGSSLRKDFTLILTNPNLSISGATTTLTSCTNIAINHVVAVAAGASIAYPLSLVFTINPPNGAAAIVTTEIISSGNSTTFEIIKNIAINSDLPFTYNIQITDNCGTTFQSLANNVNPNPVLVIGELPGKCGDKFLSLGITNFIPPITVNFIQSPTGFLPSSFNLAHPGPFASGLILFGDINNPVPFGNYEVEITDSCGRKDIATYQLIDQPIQPSAVGRNNGCGAIIGSITITMPQNRKIVTAIVTAGPSNYIPIPNNVSNLIDTNIGSLTLPNLPIGFYNFTIIDDCGDTFLLINVEVPVFIRAGLSANLLPNCVFGSGSIQISSGNGSLTSITITSAPSNYNGATDVSNNIKNGSLFLTNLWQGSYTFLGIDICGYQSTATFDIIGYNRTETGFIVQRNCGAYNIIMNDISNGVTQQLFWLQKLNPTTNIWEHPLTGVDYTEGSIPNITNGLALTNNATTFNLVTEGIFRILKIFRTYDFGSNATTFKTCIDDLGQFEYENELKILGAYSLNCQGGSGASSMVIDVLGVAPYNFSIIQKDNAPFFVNNGTNNTFTGLLDGSYLISVSDNCGSRTGTFTLGALPGLVTATQPNGIIVCSTNTAVVSTFDLTTQTPVVLGIQNPNNYTVSYHTTIADAQSGINPIANPNFFANTSNPQTLSVRVIHKTITGCYATQNFVIYVGQEPVLSPQSTKYVCDNLLTTLSVEQGYDEYLWSTGATTSAIEVGTAGTYTVIASNVNGTLKCNKTLTINVELSGTAQNITYTTQDWTENTNSISVFNTGAGIYQYSIDNINFQTSNVFSNLLQGSYTVYIKDVKGDCGLVSINVVLLNYPKFFTPNGDSYNDFWKVKNMNFEPKLFTYIYDRYGKLITAFDANSPGWDGRYNGIDLPSDDYWFVVNRQDGRIFKGHFAMKR